MTFDVLRKLGARGRIASANALARPASSSKAVGRKDASSSKAVGRKDASSSKAVGRKDASSSNAVGRKIASAILPALALAIAPPAAAQFQSEGYQFLEAVKDKDGDKATDMLNKPGTQVVNSRDLTSGDTGLHITVARRDLTWTRFLLQRGADPNIRNKKGVAPLQLATTLGFVDAVEALIKNGADVNVSDQTGETPLIAAVHQRNTDLARVLLDKGADPDHNDNSGRSARQYVELMSGNTLMKQVFKEADDKRAGKEPKRQYGPSF